MKRSLVAFLVISWLYLALIPGAEALVLIYDGPVAQERDTASQMVALPKRARAYIVVNFEAGEVAVVYYFKVGKKKFYQDSGLATLKGTSSIWPDGRTASVLSDASAGAVGALSSHRLQTLKGPNSSLSVRSTPPLEVVRPAKVSYHDMRGSSDGIISSFADHHHAAVLNRGLTISANNASQSAQAAQTALIERLVARGYQPAP